MFFMKKIVKVQKSIFNDNWFLMTQSWRSEAELYFMFLLSHDNKMASWTLITPHKFCFY